MKSPWLRKVLIGIGVLVLLVGGTLAYLAATFDANAYKGVAIDWMKTNRDRTLVINGPVRLSFFPQLALQVSGISLSEKGRSEVFLGIDEAALSVAVMPLLRKQVVVDRVQARGVSLNYWRDAQGLSNLDDLLARDAERPPDTPSAPEAPARTGEPSVRFDVSRIEFDEFRLAVHDVPANVMGVVSLKSLSTGRLADQVESAVKLEAHLALRSPALQGDLTGHTQLTPDLAAKGLKLRDMALAWKGTLPGMQAVDARLRGALAYDGGKGTLQAEGVELAGGASLGAVRLADSTLAIERFAYDPEQRAVLLSNLAVKIAGTQGGHPLSMHLAWPSLSVKGDTLTGSALTGRLQLQGPTTFESSFKTAAPSGSFARIVVPNIESTLSGRSGARQLSGTAHATLTLSPKQGSLALTELDTHLKLTEPSLQPLSIAIAGRADATAQNVRWALKGAVNSNPYTSEGSAILATTPLTLNVTANFATLDLNRLLPPEAAASAPAGPSPTGAGKPAGKPAEDRPIDLSPLRSLQGRFDLRAGNLAYRQYRVADAALAATLEGGMLRLNQFTGKAWGGSFSATGLADARASRVALTAAANGVNANALLKDIAQKDVLEGTGRVAVDVDTAGASVNEFKSRLKGKAGLQLRDGAIKGVNLAKSLRQAKAAIGMKRADERQQASQTEKTDFSELAATFTITNGVARNDDLDLKSPFLRIGGNGSVDIGKSQIDYTARATVASTSKGQDGAELAALKGMTVPVHLSGPLDAMSWRIEWSAVAVQLLQTEAGAQVRNKLLEKLGLGSASGAASAASGTTSSTDAAKEKLKERIKGLFK